jgi:hypothetical protein
MIRFLIILIVGPAIVMMSDNLMGISIPMDYRGIIHSLTLIVFGGFLREAVHRVVVRMHY